MAQLYGDMWDLLVLVLGPSPQAPAPSPFCRPPSLRRSAPLPTPGLALPCLYPEPSGASRLTCPFLWAPHHQVILRALSELCVSLSVKVCYPHGQGIWSLKKASTTEAQRWVGEAGAES